MKTKRSAFTGLLVGMTALLGLMSAPAMGAITLSFDPVSPTVAVGGFVDVDIVISGLGDGFAPSVGVFDIDVLFDDSIVGFDSVVFGPLAGLDLDVLDAGGNPTFATPFPGGLNLFELSFDSVFDLDTKQLKSFPLATVTFKGLALGTSSLSLFMWELGDSLGGDLLPDVVTEGGDLDVIPAPGAALLAMMGFGLVGWVKKRRIA